MTKKFTINGKTILLVVEYSKIGFGYPKLFIEQVACVSYVMVDVYLGATFNMPYENWAAWYNDAVEGTIQDIEDAGIDYAALCTALK